MHAYSKSRSQTISCVPNSIDNIAPYIKVCGCSNSCIVVIDLVQSFQIWRQFDVVNSENCDILAMTCKNTKTKEQIKYQN